MTRRALLPDHVLPAELAAHLGVSERTLRETARELGAFRQFGKRMILLREDVDAIMEARRGCQSKSTAAATSGTTAAPLPAGDYAALLARRKSPSPKGSRPRPSARPGAVISMDRGRG